MRTIRLRSHIFVILLAIVALLIIPVSQARAQDDKPVAVVTAATVNLRSGPGLDFSEVGAAHANDEFPVLGRAHGSNRVWYKVQLPSGETGWISERVVNIVPSADDVPWLDDNPTKVDMIMDCGSIPPVLFVGAGAEVTKPGGLVLYDAPGVGKATIGSVALHEIVSVLDGPFCTRLAADFYEVQWQVETGSGQQGYMFEGRPDGLGGYNAYTVLNANTKSSVTPSSKTIKYTDRPTWVTDANVQEVISIFQDVQKGKSDSDAAQAQLQKVVDANSTQTLAWIVRRVPIYDGKTNRWESFARYEDLTIMEWNLTSQLDTDPVDTAIDILFGNYASTEDVWAEMGCGGS